MTERSAPSTFITGLRAIPLEARFLQDLTGSHSQCNYTMNIYLVVLLSRKKPYTGKSDPNPEVFIALIPEKNFLPSRSDSLFDFSKLILDLSHSMTKTNKMTCVPSESDQTGRMLCALWVAYDPVLLQADIED